MATDAYIRQIGEVAREFLDYLKFFARQTSVPEDEAQRQSMLEVIRIEEEMIEYFHEFMQEHGELARKNGLEPIAETFAGLRGKRATSYNLEGYRNLRLYQTALTTVSERDVPADLRDNIIMLQKIIAMAVHINSRSFRVESSDRNKDAIIKWKSRIDDRLKGWRR